MRRYDRKTCLGLPVFSRNKSKNHAHSNHLRQRNTIFSSLLEAFKAGLTSFDDFDSTAFLEAGASFFDGHFVKLSMDFYAARLEFVLLAAKMLKAKVAHEKTIFDMCLKASQVYITKNEKVDEAAHGLADAVLAEADKEYIHIEPNFLVQYKGYEGVIHIGRVKIMRTAEASAQTLVGAVKKIDLLEGAYPDLLLQGDTIRVGMPAMVWVVDTPSTKENVSEEAKWLIDVAVSLLRFEFKEAPPYFPTIGEIEAHPTVPSNTSPNHVTIEGDTVWTGKMDANHVYEIGGIVATSLAGQIFKERAETIFDPPNQSLALRVAQGLGWMTRGRQVKDRAERLLAFFTALEALLSSDDKSSPIVQTISRFVSVIYTQNIESRLSIFNRVKAFYNLRSKVVHAGRRDVLWSDVNTLQRITEAVFSVVLNRCDLTMSQETFASSLANASHGTRWVFAPAEK